MLTLEDGKLLYFTGDSLPFGTDGRAAPQDDSSHVGKILLVNPDEKVYTVVAKGLRNPQHAEFVAGNNELITFMDIGGVTAEEINVVSVEDLLSPTHIENFGWGRNAEDGKAREGTTYIQPGTGGTWESPPFDKNAPVPEPGFVQPYAQFRVYGDVVATDFIAISGPVTSTVSFIKGSLQMLFADLNAGTLFGTVAPVEDSVADVTVCFVNIKEIPTTGSSSGEFPSVNHFNSGLRADPRFFRFPDGKAGVLLEKTGKFYSIEEM